MTHLVLGVRKPDVVNRSESYTTPETKGRGELSTGRQNSCVSSYTCFYHKRYQKYHLFWTDGVPSDYPGDSTETSPPGESADLRLTSLTRIPDSFRLFPTLRP